MLNDYELRQQICNLAAANGFTAAVPDTLSLLAMSGSDRRFYRVVSNKTSCIAIASPASSDEQQAWLDINRFLHSCSIAVPDMRYYFCIVVNAGKFCVIILQPFCWISNQICVTQSFS